MANTKTEVPGRRGRESYSHTKADARKDKRRREADDRQRKYDALTPAKRLARAKSRGGSKREIARLEALIQVQNKVADEVVTQVLTEEKRTSKRSKR